MGQAQKAAELRRNLKEELGPGMVIVLPQSKAGLDGGPGTIVSLMNQKDAVYDRVAKANQLCLNLGFNPGDKRAMELKAPFLDNVAAPYAGPIWDARNSACDQFLRGTLGSALMFIDGDMEWSQSDIEKIRVDLANHPELDMIGGIVSTRTVEEMPCIYRWDQDTESYPRLDIETVKDKIGEDGVLEIDGLGQAFTAIRRSYLERVTPERNGFFWQVFKLSEDLFFCHMGRSKHEMRIGVDTTVTPRHVGLKGFRWAAPAESEQRLYGVVLQRLERLFATLVSTAAYPSSIATEFEGEDVMSVFGDEEFDLKLQAMTLKFKDNLADLLQQCGENPYDKFKKSNQATDES